MPVVKYIDHTGKEFKASVAVGESVMQGAVDNMIEGILAECGGACACATCHCYVDDAWADKTGAPESMEQDMLEAVVDPKPTSRLSCQLTVTDDMDGLVVHLPETQY